MSPPLPAPSPLAWTLTGTAKVVKRRVVQDEDPRGSACLPQPSPRITQPPSATLSSAMADRHNSCLINLLVAQWASFLTRMRKRTGPGCVCDWLP